MAPDLALPPDFVPHSGQLAGVWLSAVNYKLNLDFALEQDEAFAFSLDVDHGVDVEGPPTAALVELRLTIEWPRSAEDPSIPIPFDLNMIVNGIFEWAEPRDEDQRRAWAEFNGLYLLWPYLRSYVVAVTAMSPLPPLTLPTLAVPRPELGTDTDEHQLDGSLGESEIPG